MPVVSVLPLRADHQHGTCMSDILYSGQIENYQAIMQLLQELRWGSIWRARAGDESMCLFTRGQDEDEDEDCLLGAVTTSPCMFGPVWSCMCALFLHDQPTLRTAKVLSTSTFLHWFLCFPICLLCCKV